MSLRGFTMASKNFSRIKQDYQVLRMRLKGTGAQVTSSFLLPVWEKDIGGSRDLMQINTWLNGWSYGWGFGLHGLQMLSDDYNLLGWDGIRLARKGGGIFASWLESVVKWAFKQTSLGDGAHSGEVESNRVKSQKKKARQWMLLSHLRTGRGWKSMQQQKRLRCLRNHGNTWKQSDRT